MVSGRDGILTGIGLPEGGSRRDALVGTNENPLQARTGKPHTNSFSLRVYWQQKIIGGKGYCSERTLTESNRVRGHHGTG